MPIKVVGSFSIMDWLFVLFLSSNVGSVYLNSLERMEIISFGQ